MWVSQEELETVEQNEGVLFLLSDRVHQELKRLPQSLQGEERAREFIRLVYEGLVKALEVTMPRRELFRAFINALGLARFSRDELAGHNLYMALHCYARDLPREQWSAHQRIHFELVDHLLHVNWAPDLI